MSRTLFLDRPAGAPRLAPASGDALRFHRALPGYAPTPLLGRPELAGACEAGAVDVKLETDRLGLPSFKIMGASWATVVALRDRLPAWWAPEHGLEPLAGELGDLTLVAATDGNHGRALARVARMLGLASRIFVPDGLSGERVAAIADEDAQVVPVDGSYDEAVERSAREGARAGRVLVSDTSWPGYEAVPAAVIEGYGTILGEVEDQLAASDRPAPDLVLVQLGVGAFGSAVIRHFAARGGPAPRIVGVEPTAAACVMASLAAGTLVHVPGPHDSVMAGLNCGTPSYVAWPLLRDGLDAVIALDDEAALDGVRTLAAGGLAVGECGRGRRRGPRAACRTRRRSAPRAAGAAGRPGRAAVRHGGRDGHGHVRPSDRRRTTRQAHRAGGERHVTRLGSAPLAPVGLAEELATRLARLTTGMRAMGASCLVAIRDQSVSYLTGYTTMTWKMHSRPIVAVLSADGRLFVLAAETEADSARLRIPGADVRAYVELQAVTDDMRLPDGRIQFAPHAAKVLGELLEDAGMERVAIDGLDAPWPPIGQLTRLVPGLEGRTVDASALVWEQRLRKSAWELARMRTASAVLDARTRGCASRSGPG